MPDSPTPTTTSESVGTLLGRIPSGLYIVEVAEWSWRQPLIVR